MLRFAHFQSLPPLQTSFMSSSSARRLSAGPKHEERGSPSAGLGRIRPDHDYAAWRSRHGAARRRVENVGCELPVLPPSIVAEQNGGDPENDERRFIGAGRSSRRVPRPCRQSHRAASNGPGNSRESGARPLGTALVAIGPYQGGTQKRPSRSQDGLCHFPTPRKLFTNPRRAGERSVARPPSGCLQLRDPLPRRHPCSPRSRRPRPRPLP
jgi:hypothetical protein